MCYLRNQSLPLINSHICRNQPAVDRNQARLEECQRYCNMVILKLKLSFVCKTYTNGSYTIRISSAVQRQDSCSLIKAEYSSHSLAGCLRIMPYKKVFLELGQTCRLLVSKRNKKPSRQESQNTKPSNTSLSPVKLLCLFCFLETSNDQKQRF